MSLRIRMILKSIWKKLSDNRSWIHLITSFHGEGGGIWAHGNAENWGSGYISTHSLIFRRAKCRANWKSMKITVPSGTSAKKHTEQFFQREIRQERLFKGQQYLWGRRQHQIYAQIYQQERWKSSLFSGGQNVYCVWCFGQRYLYSYNAVCLATDRIAKETGLNITLHILRQTYATRLEEDNIQPKLKQYLLGHA